MLVTPVRAPKANAFAAGCADVTCSAVSFASTTSWADGGPVVTVIVRCDLLVRGRMWPRCGRSWSLLLHLARRTVGARAEEARHHAEQNPGRSWATMVSALS